MIENNKNDNNDEQIETHSLSVFSWNVLYRKYEEQYNPHSDILKKFPEENDRQQGILEMIKHYINPYMIMCLQECDKQLLDLLKHTIRTHTIFSTKIRDDEYLVTLSPYGFLKEDCENHPSSNGYLIISNKKYRIVNCHLLPQRYAKVDVLGFIKNLPTDKITIVAGDFNEGYYKVSEKLNNRYLIPRYGKTYKHKEIDFIIIDTKIRYHVNQITNNMSDHKAIQLVFS